jgi:hypothetical protein
MKRNRVFALLLAGVIGVLVLPLAFGGSKVAAQNGKCSTETIKGKYGAEVSGWSGTGSARVPVAQAGFVTLDGKGNIVDGTAETVVDGVLLPPAAITGTYTVDSDSCTGTATSTIGTFFFAIVDNGKQTRILGTTPGFTVHGEAVRQ